MSGQTQEVRKVGGTAAAKQAGGAVAAAAVKAAETKPEKVKKAKRTDFNIKTATMKDNAGNNIPVPLDTEGRLTAAPNNWDRKLHKQIGRKQFADEAANLEYKASKLDQQAAAIKIQADKMRNDAKTARTYGDPEKRKAMGKAEKMARQYLELQQSLSKDGAQGMPSLEDILAKVKKQMEEALASKAVQV